MLIRNFTIYILFFMILLSSFIAALPPVPPETPLPTEDLVCEISNGGTEICDSLDNDCDGTADEDVCSAPSEEESGSGSGGGGGSSSSGGSKNIIYFPAPKDSSPSGSGSNDPLQDSPEIYESENSNEENSANSQSNTENFNSNTGDVFGRDVSMLDFFENNSNKILMFVAAVSITLLIVLIIFKAFKRNSSGNNQGNNNPVNQANSSVPYASKSNQATYNQTQSVQPPSNQARSGNTSLTSKESLVVDYISKMRASGYTEAQITSSMRASGWPDDKITMLQNIQR